MTSRDPASKSSREKTLKSGLVESAVKFRTWSASLEFLGATGIPSDWLLANLSLDTSRMKSLVYVRYVFKVTVAKSVRALIWIKSALLTWNET